MGEICIISLRWWQRTITRKRWRTASAAATKRTFSSRRSTGWRSHSFCKRRIRRAAEEAWDEWESVGHDVVVGAVRIFGRHAGAAVAFIEVAVALDELVILNERAVVVAAGTVGPVGRFLFFRW